MASVRAHAFVTRLEQWLISAGCCASMTFKAAVDDPTRFKRSRTVGAHFGLVPRRYQSGEQDNPGRISKAGDRDARATLYAAANAPLMRTMAGSQIKSWGMRLMRTLPVAIGGDNEAPSPGYFGRAAVCSCLAIGIKMTATRENVHLDAVRVAIEQDWDNRGVLAMEGVSSVPSETRISIDITSPEPEEEVGSLVARALGKDPWVLALRDAQPVTSELSVNGMVT